VDPLSGCFLRNAIGEADILFGIHLSFAAINSQPAVCAHGGVYALPLSYHLAHRLRSCILPGS
jgi:hypothetical protein